MQSKFRDIKAYWQNEKDIDLPHFDREDFDYHAIDALATFEGTHPGCDTTSDCLAKLGI
jgi:hypothetical protein